jgi:hypothetical protein
MHKYVEATVSCDYPVSPGLLTNAVSVSGGGGGSQCISLTFLLVQLGLCGGSRTMKTGADVVSRVAFVMRIRSLSVREPCVKMLRLC